MNLNGEDWGQVAQIIHKCPADSRYKLQPKLESWITARTIRGKPVPPAARQLNDELRDEAIEAQFDNFPV